MHRYPREFNEFGEAFRNHVLLGYRPPTPEFSRQAIVVTQGSCFARNIHEALEKAGIRSAYFEMLEAFNTPLANRILYDYVLGGVEPTSAHHAEAVPPVLRETIRKQIAAASIIILTVGLIYAPFFEGELRFTSAGSDKTEWRKTSFSENVGHLRRILELFHAANPSARLIVTLSPIPISGLPWDKSAIVGDCVSKSTLRAAIDAVLDMNLPGVSYWPAFEAIRWLSGHTGPVFGAEGEDARHPGKSYVETIVKEFIAAYFKS